MFLKIILKENYIIFIIVQFIQYFLSKFYNSFLTINNIFVESDKLRYEISFIVCTTSIFPTVTLFGMFQKADARSASSSRKPLLR